MASSSTHGTDMLEETAYALARLVDTTVPLVVTGPMRTPAMPGSDGPANLSSAISAAAYATLTDYGPVMTGAIMRAYKVRVFRAKELALCHVLGEPLEPVLTHSFD